MSRSSMTYTIHGDKEVIKALDELSYAVEKRLVNAAGTAALKPVVADMRATCPANTGNLRKSLGVKKIKRTPRGRIVLSAGPRQGYDWIDEKTGETHKPFKYAVPLEYGHKGAPPAGFMRAAYNKHRESIVVHFAAELKERIEKEMNK